MRPWEGLHTEHLSHILGDVTKDVVHYFYNSEESKEARGKLNEKVVKYAEELRNLCSDIESLSPGIKDLWIFDTLEILESIDVAESAIEHFFRKDGTPTSFTSEVLMIPKVRLLIPDQPEIPGYTLKKQNSALLYSYRADKGGISIGLKDVLINTEESIPDLDKIEIQFVQGILRKFLGNLEYLVGRQGGLNDLLDEIKNDLGEVLHFMLQENDKGSSGYRQHHIRFLTQRLCEEGSSFVMEVEHQGKVTFEIIENFRVEGGVAKADHRVQGKVNVLEGNKMLFILMPKLDPQRGFRRLISVAAT